MRQKQFVHREHGLDQIMYTQQSTPQPPEAIVVRNASEIFSHKVTHSSEVNYMNYKGH